MLVFIYINVFQFCFAENRSYLIRNNNIQNAKLLYGDIYSIDDILLSLSEYEDKNKETDKSEIGTENSTTACEIFDDIAPLKLQGEDVKDFNDLIKITNNMTRRGKGVWQGFYDPEEPQEGGLKLETDKKEKLKQIIIQFTIHARYYIKKAILQKDPVRMDKRYKMGYLFNRLRRLKYEQLKVVSAAKKQEASRYRGMNAMLRQYEKIVRFDVDIRDTIKWIKTLNDEPLVPYHFPELVKKPGS